MAQNDRFVVKHVHGEGWAVKKTNADRASSVHETQREAEKRQRKSFSTLEVGKSGFGEAEHSEIRTPAAAMTRPPRMTVATGES